MTVLKIVPAALLACGLLAGAAQTQAQAQTQAKSAKSRSALAGFDNSNSKEPYKIDANRLEVQQSANKAVYAGDVVVVQGTMTMRCSQLEIFFNRKEEGGKKGAVQNASVADAAGGLKRLECLGPVTINKEKQTATANKLVYENDIVTMTGSVVMSDGDNVQAGEKMVYNTKTSIGQMDGGRVRGIFTPGSDAKAGSDSRPGQKPKT